MDILGRPGREDVRGPHAEREVLGRGGAWPRRRAGRGPGMPGRARARKPRRGRARSCRPRCPSTNRTSCSGRGNASARRTAASRAASAPRGGRAPASRSGSRRSRRRRWSAAGSRSGYKAAPTKPAPMSQCQVTSKPRVRVAKSFAKKRNTGKLRASGMPSASSASTSKGESEISRESARRSETSTQNPSTEKYMFCTWRTSPRL